MAVHFHPAIAKQMRVLCRCSRFGVVYLAKRRKEGKQVAIKCVSGGMNARKELKALINVVQILRAYSDPFVVKYYESFMVQKTRSDEVWVSHTHFSLFASSFQLSLNSN